MQTILDLLAGKTIFDNLIAALDENFQDFYDVRERYIEAMDALQDVLGEDAVQTEKNAICQQIASTVRFSGVLGLQANYHYFMDPVGGNFLDADSETYLRENIAKHLPEYDAAQQSRSKFYSQLDETLKALYAPMTDYVSYLETVGPKLAHYYGFVLGNDLLQQVVPGYQPDMAFTLRYCMQLEKYFGKRFNFNNILKSSFCIC